MNKMHGLYMANVFAIPGTGRRGSYGKYLRSPRNIGVKRGLLTAFGSLRGEKVPPNQWDDLLKMSTNDRNWKRFRKTRWHRMGA